jgi:hypothetical protein
MPGITYTAQTPIVQSQAGQTGVVPLRSFSASATCLDGALVVLAGGLIAPAAANVAAGIAGVAAHDSRANYGGEANIGAYSPIDALGISQVGTLLPLSPGQTLVAQILPDDLVIGNLTATTGWVTGGAQQANIGTQVGIAIDGTTGFYVFDPTASNKVGVITTKPNGPFASVGNDAGNLGASVGVTFFGAALV